MDDVAHYLTPADGFDRLAYTYDARFSNDPVLLLESVATLTALPRLEGRRVADLGCGTGRYTLQLPRLGAAQTIGIDLSPQMLDVARAKARRSEQPVAFRLGDLKKEIPLADDWLDVAICALTLTFLPDLECAFSAIARRLRAGGTLVISEVHPHGLRAERAASAALLRKDHAPYLRFTSAEGDECRIARTPHLISDYVAAAASAGLTLERIAEPAVDHRLATTYPYLRDRIGVPLALTLRFQKED